MQGQWWDVLQDLGITLLVTREYEHLVLALTADDAGLHVTYLPLPHPSGLAVDRRRNAVSIASTRNPNQVLEFEPATGILPRADAPAPAVDHHPLVPVSSRFLPGCLYIHDLAVIDGVLHANAVGQNAVVRLSACGPAERVWWPLAVETSAGPALDRNYLQLNSIAAGPSLTESYFSASADRISVRRPGHRNFPVDRRGVIFSGATREPVVRGLTRPHSARLHRGRLWVDNSGYGQLGYVEGEQFQPFLTLPGWTRGLCFHGDVAFVGTSRVIPRFQHYAPGLDVRASMCGIHAVDLRTATVVGSITWPTGNQIFAIEWLDRDVSTGFPFERRRRGEHERRLFYAYTTTDAREVSCDQ